MSSIQYSGTYSVIRYIQFKLLIETCHIFNIKLLIKSCHIFNIKLLIESCHIFNIQLLIESCHILKAVPEGALSRPVEWEESRDPNYYVRDYILMEKVRCEHC